MNTNTTTSTHSPIVSSAPAAVLVPPPSTTPQISFSAAVTSNTAASTSANNSNTSSPLTKPAVAAFANTNKPKVATAPVTIPTPMPVQVPLVENIAPVEQPQPTQDVSIINNNNTNLSLKSIAENVVERMSQQQLAQTQSPPPVQQQQAKAPLNEQTLSQQLQQQLTQSQQSLVNLITQQKSTSDNTSSRLGIQIPNQQPQQSQLGSPNSLLLAQQQLLQQQQASSGLQSFQETFITTALGAAPLGKVQLTKEQTYQLNILEATTKKMPLPTDTERLRTYMPRKPTITPSYFPLTPPPGHDSLEFLCKLECGTLFFMFYYMESTKAQFLAAQALKKLSWRFHMRYMMWFQRLEEPTCITDEFEQVI